MKSTEEYFDQLIAESMEQGIKKMSAYGTSWTSYRPGSLLTRMLNKGKRIVTIQETKENQVGEKISGEFKEIMSYAVLLGIMVENTIPLHSELSNEKVTEYRKAIFEKAKSLMLKKNHDYGEAWRTMSQDEIVDEINVKIKRMKSSVAAKSPIIDNIYDVINYCAFALILLAEGAHADL